MIDPKLFKKFDYLLLIIVIAILIFSTVILKSATANVAGDPLFFIKKQLLWIGVGIVGLVIMLSFNYVILAGYQKYLYVLNLVMLAMVLVFGKEVNGAKSWIDFGPFVFQPSEFSKVFLILAFSQFLVERQEGLNTLKSLVPCFLYFVPPIGLILLQPDMGTSLVFFGILFGMLFVAGARPALLGGIIGAAAAVTTTVLVAHFYLGMKLFFIKGFQLMRLLAFLDPYGYAKGAGYQLVQSMIAVGSGGIFGKGLQQGTQVQLNFLPYHYTDFIFSVVGEELGFVGAVGLLLLYFLLIYRLIIIAQSAKDLYGTYIVTGVASMFVFHVLVNVGMTIGIMPITGIPLPLFSYGGSSMISSMMALGLMFNIGMRRQKILF